MMEHTPTIDRSAVDGMIASGVATRLDADTVDAFLAQDGLLIVLFSGLGKNRPEGHDVAVALREMLAQYGGAAKAAIVAEDAEEKLKSRFRVVILPSLAFVLGGETLEVLPRVLDWKDYAGAFKRYLGPPPAAG